MLQKLSLAFTNLHFGREKRRERKSDGLWFLIRRWVATRMSSPQLEVSRFLRIKSCDFWFLIGNWFIQCIKTDRVFQNYDSSKRGVVNHDPLLGMYSLHASKLTWESQIVASWFLKMSKCDLWFIDGNQFISYLKIVKGIQNHDSLNENKPYSIARSHCAKTPLWAESVGSIWAFARRRRWRPSNPFMSLHLQKAIHMPHCLN